MVLRYLMRRLVFSALRPVVNRYIHRRQFGGVEIKTQGDLSFLPFRRRASMEEVFLGSLDLKGKIVYNIGAYIGILAIFYAKSVTPGGRVIAFEPNPQTYERAVHNLSLNSVDNVQIVNIGIGDKKQTTDLCFRSYRPAAGSMVKSIQSRILADKKGSETVRAEVTTLDGFIETNNPPKPDLVSMDIEGMEYQALVGMAETIKAYEPAIYIEVHGADEKRKIDNATRIQRFLDECGYEIYHVESRRNITAQSVSIAKSGHIYCLKTH